MYRRATEAENLVSCSKDQQPLLISSPKKRVVDGVGQGKPKDGQTIFKDNLVL